MNNKLNVENVFSWTKNAESSAVHLSPGHIANRELSFLTIAPHNKSVIGLIESGSVAVVAVLLWNFPALIFVFRAILALATAKSVIAKPAEQTSLSTYRRYISVVSTERHGRSVQY